MNFSSNPVGSTQNVLHPDVMSIARYLTLRAEETPDAIAYAAADYKQDAPLTYSTLCKHASSIAFRLASESEAGDRVILAYQEPLDFVPAFFGCCLAGVVPVPIPIRHDLETVLAIAQDSGATIALSSEEKELFPGLRWIHTNNSVDKPDVFMRNSIDGSPALLQYTSGSTRKPKGVIVTETGLHATIEDLARGGMNTKDSVLISWLPYFHDMGLVYGILTPLYVGFPSYLMSPEKFVLQPISWLRAISAHGGTHTAAPNFAYALCTDRASELSPSADLSSLAYSINGAEPIRCDIIRNFETAFSPFGLRASVVVSGYGLAEATLKVASGNCKEGTKSEYFDRENLSKGKILVDKNGVELANCGASSIDTKVKIVDPETHSLCPTNTVGEIWVSGSTVANGYWNRQEESDQVFNKTISGIPGSWLRTGDLGFIYNGGLFVTSRLKDLIIVGGRNFYSHDLETTVTNSHPFIRKGRVFAAALHGKSSEGILIGAEIRNNCSQSDTDAVLSTIRTSIIRVHSIAPERIVLLRRGSILRTSSGKIRRVATRDALLLGNVEVLADSQAEVHSNDLVDKISQFIPEAAHNPSSRFIDLGLDSLTASRLSAVLRTTFNIDLPFSDLFNISLGELKKKSLEASQKMVDSPNSCRTFKAGENFELSEMQQAYWIGQQEGVILGKTIPHIRVDFEVKISRAVELNHLLAQLIEYYPSLRIKVGSDGLGSFTETTYEPLLLEKDLRELNPENQKESLKNTRRALSKNDDHPLATAISRITDEKAIFHVKLGLIACDLRSFLLLMNELSCRSPALPSSSIAIPTCQSLPESKKQEWVDQINSIAPAPELPMKMALADVSDPRFSNCYAELSSETFTALSALSQSLGITTTSLCIAIFADLLRLWSTTHAFTLNITCNTRPAESSNLIGEYTNSILLSLKEHHESFALFAKDIQKKIWDSLDSPWYSGISILRELSRRNGSPILMPIVLTSLLSGDTAEDMSVFDKIGDVVDLTNPTPQVSMHVILGKRQDKFVVIWETLEQLFHKEIIDSMFSTFLTSLEKIASNPRITEKRTISQIPEEVLERRQQLNKSQATSTPRRIETPIIENALLSPNAIAVVKGDEKLTYGELLSSSKNIAILLREQGISQGDIVATVIEQGPIAVTALLGIMLAGATYLPLEPSWPEVRIQNLIEEAGACYALTTKKYTEANFSIPVLFVDECPSADPVNTLNPIETTRDVSSAAYVIFTSGSTGKPKGVLVSHSAVANTIDDINTRFSVNKTDSVLCVSSIAFDLSVYDIFGTLTAGGTIVFPKHMRDPDLIAEALLNNQITIWNSVPAVLELLLDVTRSFSSNLRLILLSGDWIAPSFSTRLSEIFPEAKLISLGGATEASIWSVMHEIVPEDSLLSSIPYGRPLSNQQCFVRTEDGRERPDGVIGELLLSGNGLAIAYLGREEETKRHFFTDKNSQRFYRTGDFARWLSNGELEFIGRADGQVKVQGYRIELGEIETTARQANLVSQAVATVLRRKNATLILLHLVPSTEQGKSTVVSEVRTELAKRLPAYMQPHHISVINAIPLTANGKVDRAKLESFTIENTELEQLKLEESNQTKNQSLETVMLATFKEVVGTNIKPEQGFFDAGATSMHIIRLRAALLSKNIDVPSLVDFFSFANIRALVTRISPTNTKLSTMNDIESARNYRKRARKCKENLL